MKHACSANQKLPARGPGDLHKNACFSVLAPWWHHVWPSPGCKPQYLNPNACSGRWGTGGPTARPQPSGPKKIFVISRAGKNPFGNIPALATGENKKSQYHNRCSHFKSLYAAALVKSSFNKRSLARRFTSGFALLNTFTSSFPLPWKKNCSTIDPGLSVLIVLR